MEELSQEQQEQIRSTQAEVVELYDLFLTDGTHLRFCSAGGDLDCVDFVE